MWGGAIPNRVSIKAGSATLGSCQRALGTGKPSGSSAPNSNGCSSLARRASCGDAGRPSSIRSGEPPHRAIKFDLARGSWGDSSGTICREIPRPRLSTHLARYMTSVPSNVKTPEPPRNSENETYRLCPVLYAIPAKHDDRHAQKIASMNGRTTRKYRTTVIHELFGDRCRCRVRRSSVKGPGPDVDARMSKASNLTDFISCRVHMDSTAFIEGLLGDASRRIARCPSVTWLCQGGSVVGIVNRLAVSARL